MTNDQVILKGFNLAREEIRKDILQALRKTAFDLESFAPEELVWTHNLLDSIGCGIYENGVFLEFITPESQALEPRSGESDYGVRESGSEAPIYGVSGIDVNRAYWGEQELFDMLNNPPSEVTNNIGWCLYYVAAMPYSEVLDRQGNDILTEEMVAPLFKGYLRTM